MCERDRNGLLPRGRADLERATCREGAAEGDDAVGGRGEVRVEGIHADWAQLAGIEAL